VCRRRRFGQGFLGTADELEKEDKVDVLKASLLH
jgi:hypothetical protein